MTARQTLSLVSAAFLAIGGSFLLQAQTNPPGRAPAPVETTGQLSYTEPGPRAPNPRSKLASLPWVLEPALEKTRQAAEAADASATIKLDTDFECGFAASLAQPSPTHLILNFNGGDVFMFYFRLTGVAGKTVRIDLTNMSPTSFGKLVTLNPVYSSELPAVEPPVSDTQALFTAATTTVENGSTESIAIPDTAKQQWHFMENAWIDREHSVLSFVATFKTDTVYVAMKYPYTPTLNEQLFAQWAKSPHAKVITPGTSTNGRPLQIIRITDIPEDQQAGHPSIVIYGREHTLENDNSWPCKGAVEFLLGDSPDAALLRKQVIFHIIPLIDPDATLASKNVGIRTTFSKKDQSKESKLYGEYFEHWVDQGGRLDLVLNLHSVQSSERNYHMDMGMTEPKTGRPAIALPMNLKVADMLTSQGYLATGIGDGGAMPARLGGWLDDTFGTMHICYEFNSQEPHRHLLLWELTSIGATMAKATGNFVAGAEGKDLRDSVDAVLAVRKAAKAEVALDDNGSVFDKEYALKEWRAAHPNTAP